MALVQATRSRGLGTRYVNLVRATFYPGTTLGSYNGFAPNFRTLNPKLSGSSYANGAMPPAISGGATGGPIPIGPVWFSVESWGWDVVKTELAGDPGHDPATIDPAVPWVYNAICPGIGVAIREGSDAEQTIWDGNAALNGWTGGRYDADGESPYVGATFQIPGAYAPGAYWTGRGRNPDGSWAGAFGRINFFSHPTYFKPGTTYTIRVRSGSAVGWPDAPNNGNTDPTHPYTDEEFTFTTADDLPLHVVASPVLTSSAQAYIPRYVPDLPPEPPTNDPPVVSNVAPAPGTAIGPHAPLSFNVTDDSGAFRRILVGVEIGTTRELAWDGSTFSAAYAGSTCTAITNGWHLVLQRAAGWPAAPSVTPFAIDQRGLENA